MKKSFVAVIIGFVSLLAIGFVVIANNNSETDQPESNKTTSSDQISQTNSESLEQANNNSFQPEVGVSEVNVEIKDFAFSPTTITIKKGTKVTWTNQDTAKHDVTPDQESENFKGSKLLARGESYSFTFDTVGSYDYICSPHPYMKAKVVVTE